MISYIIPEGLIAFLAGENLIEFGTAAVADARCVDGPYVWQRIFIELQSPLMKPFQINVGYAPWPRLSATTW